MDKLGTSLPPLQDLSIESGPSMSPPLVEYAAERADFLFRQYRRGEANDPDTYVAAAAAILSDYPAETIRYVTDPRTGLASNPWRDPSTGYVHGGMPSPAHIKWACEEHYGPIQRRLDRDRQTRAQLEERKRLEPPREKRPTYEELIQRCEAAGLQMRPNKTTPKVSVDQIKAKYGISDGIWNAIPNAKARS